MFHVFAAIYCEKYGDAGGVLFGYANRIMELQREEPTSYMWLIYDILFRHLKARSPRLRWHVIYAECEHKARNYAERFTKRNSTYNRGAPGRGRGRGFGRQSGTTRTDYTCDAFNEGKVCQFKNCRFSHACSGCKGSHPFAHCRQQKIQPSAVSANAKPSK